MGKGGEGGMRIVTDAEKSGERREEKLGTGGKNESREHWGK